MPRRPNYNLERAERNRAKQAKRDEKLRQRQEATAQRKAAAGQAIEPEEKEPSQ
jgi:uncharacterized protein YaiL (DUF2058 family)